MQKVVNQNKATTFNQLSFTASPETKPNDLLSHYYNGLITMEAIRYYNSVLANPLIKDKKLDTPFQIGTKVLKPLSVLIKQTNDYLNDKDFIVTNPNNPTIVAFVFETLLETLIPLYFSIQQHFKPYLTEVYEKYEDFEMYVLENAGFKIQLTEVNKVSVSIAKSNNMGFSFGFKGDDTKLKNLVLTLCNHKNLLDEEVTKPEVLIDLLTASDIYKKQYHIKFGCNSNLATYIVDCFKKKLPKFTYSNIGNSNYFFTNTGTPVSASLLSNSKSNNPINKAPLTN